MKLLIPLATLLLAPLAALHAADFRLGSPFSDHMVLQREKPVAVWGWADAGESVAVAFDDRTKTATAGAEGKWSLKLDALKASAESRTFTVTGKDGRKVEVKDVLVGEVWLGSGQSNMAMTVAGCYHFDAEKAGANFPLIRHYRESSGPADAPQAEGKGTWQVCTPENVGGFSAALYFFGREIHKEVGVPVGLINTSVGGTVIESWVAAEVQSSDPETKTSYDTRLDAHQKFDPTQAPALHQKQLAIWKAASEKAKANSTPFVVPPPKDPLAMWKLKGGPAGLYNGKVINLVPYTLRGMLCGIRAKATPAATPASTTSSSPNSSRVGARFGRTKCPSPGCSFRTSPRPAKAGLACVSPCSKHSRYQRPAWPSPSTSATPKTSIRRTNKKSVAVFPFGHWARFTAKMCPPPVARCPLAPPSAAARSPLLSNTPTTA